MTTQADRELSTTELEALILGKHQHIKVCKDAHREECIEITRLERDLLIEVLQAKRAAEQPNGD